MSISLVNVTNSPGSTGTVTSFTTDVPAGVQDGDYLEWTLTSNNATAQSAPAGWNTLDVNTTTGHSQNTFWRIASSEPASYTHSTLTSARWGGCMKAWRGVDQTTPHDVAIPAHNSGTTTLSYPAITPTTAGAVVVSCGSCTGPSGTTDVNWSVGNMDAVDTDAGSNVAGASNAFASHGRFAWTSGAFTPTGPQDDVVTARTIGATWALRPAADTPVTGTLAGTAPAATAALTGQPVPEGTLAGTAPAATASLAGTSGTATVTGSLTGVAPAATAEFVDDLGPQMPGVTVEIAFASTPDDTTPTWVDVSDYVEAATPITITRGRSDELTEVQPSRLQVTLDNSDGRFTPANTAGAYYPNVKKNRQIRVTATPVGGTERDRFHGYIDEWPVQWPTGTGDYSAVTITASSRRARLAAGMELRSIIEEEYLLDSPTVYYPMGEPKPVGPGQAGDVSGNQQPNLVADGTGPAIQWQAATGPGTDALSAPVFDDGRYLLLTGVDLVDDTTDASTLVECFVNTTDSGTVRGAVSLFGPDLWSVALGIDTTGHAMAQGGTIGFAPDFDLASTTTINDGETHHLALRMHHDTPIAIDLFVDGVLVDSGGLLASQLNRMTVGNYAPAGLPQSGGWVGSISHVAVYSTAADVSDARIADHAASGLTGFEGDSSDERIARLATYGGIDPSQLALETGSTTSMAAQETTGKTVIALMQEVADTEGGILFDSGAGILTFHSRGHRYNAAAVFALDAGMQQIGAALETKLDGQQLVNDIAASRVGGDSQVRVLNADSITEYGVKREQIDLVTTSDNELLDAANWRVNRYSEPDIRITAASVDLVNQPPALIVALLDAEIGDKVTLDNLPAQAPAASVGLFIEGVAETIGVESYTINFELSPAARYDVWELNSATHSQLDQTTVLAY